MSQLRHLPHSWGLVHQHFISVRRLGSSSDQVPSSYVDRGFVACKVQHSRMRLRTWFRSANGKSRDLANVVYSHTREPTYTEGNLACSASQECKSANLSPRHSLPLTSPLNLCCRSELGNVAQNKSQKMFAGVGLCSLSCAPFAAVMSTSLAELGGNHVFMSALWSWLIAQVAKLFTAWYREGKWDYKVMFDSGGMPSSHTALVVGLTTSIAYQFGLGSVYFPLSLAFTLIVMYDAAGVRRHAGKQAEVLNKIVEDMFHGSSISNTKLKEVLGHSPLQVVSGAILGVAVGMFYMLKYS